MPPLLLRHGHRRSVHISPPAVLILLYASLIAIGTLLLKLSVCAPGPTSWITALFTAASAVTVTGLSIADTGTHFTLLGQGVILLLIQFGGLGLMTVAAFVLSVFGMRMPVRQRIVLGEDLNYTDMGSLLGLVFTILKVVVVCEAAGAAVLAFAFVPVEGWGFGIWSSVFHAVSAFNNAGFSLYPDSLTRFVGNPIVNLTVPALFIVGGLGYSVLTDIRDQRRWAKLSLHSKLMLVGTAGLIAWGVLSFAFLEWNNPGTLGALDVPSRLWASWFQGVTTRTAGFNTVNIGNITDDTSLTMIVLMIIGSGSTSTGGGIKVTTFMVLCLATISFLKRQERVAVFGRSLGPEEVLKALALAVLSMAVLMASLFILLLATDVPFLALLFETASALGTVGLSKGATGQLGELGRFILIFVMFVGRVGPLSLGFFLGMRTRPRVRYPSGRIYLG